MDETLRTVVVTGAARGIGRGVARRFAALGWCVVLLDRDSEALERLAAELPEAVAVTADVSDEAQVEAAFELVGATCERLDALVNNAGLATPYGPALADLELAAWHEVLETNLTGPMLCAKHALALLRADDGGAIVNVASTRAHQSEPDGEAYAASKGGLLALTHAMAVSLGPEVRVNAVTAGWIHDPESASAELPRPHDERFHPSGRVGRPEDVAAVITFLCGEDAGFVTGAEYACDGGVPRRMIYPE